MATILLQAAGAALGSVFGPVGAMIGRAAGALAGSAIDRALIGGSTVEGARLSSARLGGAAEGTAIPRLYGTARLGGTLIWATRFEEQVTTERQGGKANGNRVRSYQYFANLALALCEGPITGVRRVWADGRELDLTEIEMRVYTGTRDQQPDPLIAARQGAGNAPAYRGIAYVVFERLPLDDFGNRIPLLQFEVIRSVGRLEPMIRAVTIIPGATEHGYAVTQVSESLGEGQARILNRNTLTASTDWQASLDELQALCPNLKDVALVVSWFGTDLRAGDCRILPGVEAESREGESRPWSVAGLGRAQAHFISRINGSPAYGGTPSDASVIEAIRDIRARGLKVTLYPFIMMDIPAQNGLPDPYGGAEQAVYPWRGRITCYPPTADRTAQARAQVDHFATRAEGYRRLVLHYAGLAEQAGGVDAFLIGSELRGLTTIRDQDDRFPFVEHLVTLAGEVRAILRPTTGVTYAADWSEYFGHHPTDGSGDVFFHLDPLWAHPAITAVGIDNYLPLSDWRDADLEAENPDGFETPDDAAAMARMIVGGERHDWYYASDEDRRERRRTPITDGAYGKPWVYRAKDLEGWWQNRHFNRRGGIEQAEPTGWLPQMKPFWFTELGCPAVDRGANQPNVFIDPKSAESAKPHFSTGARSDSQQRRFLEAHLGHWTRADAPPGMVDPDHVYLWTWDARPQPAFPEAISIWSDGENWRRGHWLNGRLGTATLADTIAAILADHGFHDFDVSAVSGDLGGYVKGDFGAARALLEPLIDIFCLDVIEADGRLRFRSRNAASLPARRIEVLADLADRPLWRETRGHDSDFAAESMLTFIDQAGDYAETSVRSQRLEAATQRGLARSLPTVMAEQAALAAAETWLRDHRLSRRRLELALGPHALEVEPGDVLRFAEGPEGRFLVTEVEDGLTRRLTLRAFAGRSAQAVEAASPDRDVGERASSLFAPLVVFLDLPRLEGGAGGASVGAFARPWRRVAVSSSPEQEGYRLRGVIERPATIGRLMGDLQAGPSGRFDWRNQPVVDLVSGELASASRLAVLNGENRMAVETVTGACEVIGFLEAEEITPGRFRLRGLLRGLSGTEWAMDNGAVAGARVVLLDQALMPLGLSLEEAGLPQNFILEPVGSAGALAGPFTFAGGLSAETPLTPLHLRAVRQADGAVEIRWKRRGRIDADGWQASEIPLDEAAEAYRLEVFDGGALKRSVTTGVSRWRYGTAEEEADFGARQSRLFLSVRQIGRLATSPARMTQVPVV
ncbi:glycoside hydrolase/phage tail family protein [Peteryoungia desertarenae]|uniref:Glycoside hydrolase/phage tail family protein n=1 Tax=Peteryoungia desertarenae TaxID=1813451 RepID=A0ABX6QNM6_9HYPH|nr:glycoside hydrolase TIM-barrel-like domain-containing protein [Peteryoungia desertarenae]QLF69877.1 glycoside hydrolase/phage tail family protein [Peteryoungia desertarenae]